jgi:hypothetical protein
LSIFSPTAPFDGAQDRLRDAAKMRRLLRANGNNLLKATRIPFGLRRPS